MIKYNNVEDMIIAHDPKDDYQKGLFAEVLFCRVLQTKKIDYIMSGSDMKAQHDYGDVRIFKDGKQFCLDVKLDNRILDTNNILIEYKVVCDDKVVVEGWFDRCPCEFIAFFIPQNYTFIVVNWIKLKNLIEKEKIPYYEIDMENQVESRHRNVPCVTNAKLVALKELENHQLVLAVINCQEKAPEFIGEYERLSKVYKLKVTA
ncbi:MAG: hypothetical protein VB064_01290 [Oscillospiraceae bacterium]|nr:hypothetical protein [Oscillospiraceae bacterium]